MTTVAEIGRGARQGFCILPLLFYLYGEYLMREALAEIGDFMIGERLLRSDLQMTGLL